MLNFHSIRMNAGFETTVSRLKRLSEPGNAILIRQDMASFRKFLSYTHSHSYKSFHSESSQMKHLEMDWLLKIACTNNITKAMNFCRPKGKEALIVSEKPLSERDLEELDAVEIEEHALSRTETEKLSEECGISRDALKLYGLEDLLIEKAAVFSVS